MKKNYEYYVGDFETTVYEGQERTDVWASGLCPLYTEDAVILHSIDDTIKYLTDLRRNVIVYYHNLKFDGSFWLDYLMHSKKYRESYKNYYDENGTLVRGEFHKDKDMPVNSFKYMISDKGQWYTITIRTSYGYIEIRDSLKLFPFSLREIGKSFKTKHQKLDMEYEGFRYPGCEITKEEEEYLKNDLFVIKEALEIMIDRGHTSSTIGSCCLAEYKNQYDKEDFAALFPDLYKKENESEGFTEGEFIRKSYKGGWVYLVEGKEKKIIKHGKTFDVNSLYPSMMHSSSGNRYPIGYGCYWKGNYIPETAQLPNRYFFVRIRTRFYLKPGYLPFIQIKDSFYYDSTECLKSSDIYDFETGTYKTNYTDENGDLQEAIVTLTLTCTDYSLFLEHYYIKDFQIIDGYWYYTMCGIFDEYIDKYMEIKQNSIGAERTLAKLFLNNLYGKFATSTDSSYKRAILKPDGVVGFVPVTEYKKKPGYIPIGSAITSYSRCFTIRAAQKNFYGKNKPGFVYADTDSCHIDDAGGALKIKGIPIHESALQHWKMEREWDKGFFVRQKTYIECIGDDISITCAGMPDRCKNLFIKSIKGDFKDINEYSNEEMEFLKNPRCISDFREGIKIPGKLIPKRIRGGILLVNTTYEMR